jgi:hypothetical protein
MQDGILLFKMDNIGMVHGMDSCAVPFTYLFSIALPRRFSQFRPVDFLSRSIQIQFISIVFLNCLIMYAANLVCSNNPSKHLLALSWKDQIVLISPRYEVFALVPPAASEEKNTHNSSSDNSNSDDDEEEQKQDKATSEASKRHKNHTDKNRNKTNELQESRNIYRSLLFDSSADQLYATNDNKRAYAYHITSSSNDNNTVMTDNSNSLIRCTLSHTQSLSKKPCSAAYDNQRNELIVADTYGDIYTINTEFNRSTCTLGHLSIVTSLELSDKYLISADADGHIRVSHHPNHYNIHSFCLAKQSFVSATLVTAQDNKNLLFSGDLKSPSLLSSLFLSLLSLTNFDIPYQYILGSLGGVNNVIYVWDYCSFNTEKLITQFQIDHSREVQYNAIQSANNEHWGFITDLKFNKALNLIAVTNYPYPNVYFYHYSSASFTLHSTLQHNISISAMEFDCDNNLWLIDDSPALQVYSYSSAQKCWQQTAHNNLVNKVNTQFLSAAPASPSLQSINTVVYQRYCEKMRREAVNTVRQAERHAKKIEIANDKQKRREAHEKRLAETKAKKAQ